MPAGLLLAESPEVYDRPYPPTGLCTSLWMQIRPQPIYISYIIPTQRRPTADQLNAHGRSSTGDPYINIVRWRNLLFCEDGHHRLERARRCGQRFVTARVFHSDPARRLVFDLCPS